VQVMDGFNKKSGGLDAEQEGDYVGQEKGNQAHEHAGVGHSHKAFAHAHRQEVEHRSFDGACLCKVGDLIA